MHNATRARMEMEKKLHRRHARRRFLRRMSLLLAVLGGLCLFISLLTALVSGIYGQRWAVSLWTFSAAYLIGGIVLLGTRQLLILLMRHRRVSRPAEPVRSRSRRRRRSGFVLVVVLVVLAAISLLIVRAQVSARAALRVEEAALRQRHLRNALAEAVFAVMREFADKEDISVDHLREPWVRDREFEWPDETGVTVRVTDENRFFDVNNVHVLTDRADRTPAGRILMDIMTQCGDFMPVARVEALKAWMDSDPADFRGTNRYMEQSPPYRASGTWLTSWRELLLVDGFDRSYFERRPRNRFPREFEADILDHITLLPVPRTRPIPVNINTASREVLLGILGYDRERLVHYILAAREEEPFRSVDGLLAMADEQALQDVDGYLDVKSEFFTLEARAYAKGETARLRVLTRRAGDGTLRILQWTL